MFFHCGVQCCLQPCVKPTMCSLQSQLKLLHSRQSVQTSHLVMSANMAFCQGLQSLSERRLQREDSMPAEAPMCRGTQRCGWESEEEDLCDYVQLSDDEPSASVPPASTARVNEIPAVVSVAQEGGSTSLATTIEDSIAPVDIVNDGVDDMDAKDKKPASDNEPHVSLPATPTESFQEITADFRVAHEGENKSLASTTPEGIIAPVDSANDGVEDADAKHNLPASGGSQYKQGDLCFYQGMAATVTSVTQLGGKSVLELQLDGQNGVRAAMVPDVKPRCPGQTPPTCQGLGVQPAQGGGGDNGTNKVPMPGGTGRGRGRGRGNRGRAKKGGAAEAGIAPPAPAGEEGDALFTEEYHKMFEALFEGADGDATATPEKLREKPADGDAILEKLVDGDANAKPKSGKPPAPVGKSKAEGKAKAKGKAKGKGKSQTKKSAKAPAKAGGPKGKAMVDTPKANADAQNEAYNNRKLYCKERQTLLKLGSAGDVPGSELSVKQQFFRDSIVASSSSIHTHTSTFLFSMHCSLFRARIYE